MAEIVEAQRAQAGRLACRIDAAPKGRAVDAPADPVDEDVVVRAREVAALREAVERTACLVGERHLARTAGLRGRSFDVGADRAADNELPAREVHVPPAQC